MKKYVNKILMLFIILFVFFINTSFGAYIQNESLTPSKNLNYNENGYVIDKYNVDIVVNENNTFDITENITAYFNEPRHGIFRTIPLKNEINRLDGTTSKNIGQISNLYVDSQYTESKEDGKYKIKIGSPSEKIEGLKNYTIKYNYNIGKDPLKNNDELYYNIIGPEWDTVIGNITFTITMPKDFDTSKLGFSSGISGSTNNSNIKYNVGNNVIKGKYVGILDSYNAITVRCELPEGYFVGAQNPFDKFTNIIFALPVIFLIISIFLWYKFGRDDEIVETVEFYPPEGFNSMEVAFLYKGNANGQDIISLLIYLANKGYIKISEYEEKQLLKTSKGFKITKLKDYDGNDINEKMFLEGLFKKAKKAENIFSGDELLECEDSNEVTSSELKNSFYITLGKISSNINTKENKDKLFKPLSSNWVIMFLMLVMIFCLITIPPILQFGEKEGILIGLLFPSMGFPLMFNFLFNKNMIAYDNGVGKSNFAFRGFMALCMGGFFAGIPWVLVVLPCLLNDIMYLYAYILGLLCVAGIVNCMIYLPRRTKYGIEMLGKLEGFKRFLETAEKDRLEEMVLQNPTYFYDILPYTYVLGVSDKWIKKFETIAVPPPSWCDTYSVYSSNNFTTFINNTMDSATDVMASSPASSGTGGSSGGGFSGGGCSGGGSGGGGGGSW